MQAWIEAELATANLGDVRRNRRLWVLLDQLRQNTEGTINQACAQPADKKAAYRFLSNEQVKPEAIRGAHEDSAWRRIQSYARVLIVQDTSSLSYSTHHKAKGMGPLDDAAHGRGFLIHTGLAVTEQGEPLGVAHQQIWVRSQDEVGQSEQRRQRVWQHKESYKWQRTVETVCRRRRPEQVMVVIGDRESDVYGLLASPRPEGVELLVRSGQNRRVEEDSRYLRAALRRSPPAGRLIVEVSRTGKREARQALCEVRYLAVTLRPPRNPDGGVATVPVKIWALAVEEQQPPKGETGIQWVLLATWPIPDWEAALEAVKFYGLRWLVEQYHYVLKSGCQIERAELREQIRLERLQALYTIVAWRLLSATYRARHDPHSACELIFTPLEWQLLYAFHHRQPYPQDQPPPNRCEAVRWVAKLGGLWGRKGDGAPGVKVIWRGFIKLYGLLDGYHLATLLSPSQERSG
jgi:hypothetical protein